jgi:RNA polymerase sigma-70 factor, ECF subfamily
MRGVQRMEAMTMMAAVEEQAVGAETHPKRTNDLALVFREDGPGLWRTIYAFTGGRRDVTEDVVAEAFARAIAHEREIREPVPWLYRTSFRLAQDELKKERRRGASEPERSADPPELVGLLEALRQLSPNQRAAIVLRFEADLAVSEVASRMGITQPTVRVHIHRGRARLRELLGDEEVEG